MTLIDEPAAEAPLRRDGPGDRCVRRLGRQHHRRRRLARRPRRLSSARSRPTSSAPASATTSAPLGVAFATAAAQDGARHRTLLHPGDAGRRAHHEHLSRRLPRTSAPRDVDPDMVGAAAVDLSRGLSVGSAEQAKDAFRAAGAIAHAAGRQVALTLSDTFCVDRYRDEFLDLMRSGTRRHPVRQRGRAEEPLPDLGLRPTAAARRSAATPGLAVVTRSEKGCGRGHPRGPVARCRRSRSSGWWTPPARATCSPRASSWPRPRPRPRHLGPARQPSPRRR